MNSDGCVRSSCCVVWYSRIPQLVAARINCEGLPVTDIDTLWQWGTTCRQLLSKWGQISPSIGVNSLSLAGDTAAHDPRVIQCSFREQLQTVCKGLLTEALYLLTVFQQRNMKALVDVVTYFFSSGTLQKKLKNTCALQFIAVQL